jgi:hypothetical protein
LRSGLLFVLSQCYTEEGLALSAALETKGGIPAFLVCREEGWEGLQGIVSQLVKG